MKFDSKIFCVSFFVMILSCTPSTPYEIRSPCVSVESEDHPYEIRPCIKRPANIKHYIV